MYPNCIIWTPKFILQWISTYSAVKLNVCTMFYWSQSAKTGPPDTEVTEVSSNTEMIMSSNTEKVGLFIMLMMIMYTRVRMCTHVALKKKSCDPINTYNKLLIFIHRDIGWSS